MDLEGWRDWEGSGDLEHPEPGTPGTSAPCPSQEKLSLKYSDVAWTWIPKYLEKVSKKYVQYYRLVFSTFFAKLKAK